MQQVPTNGEFDSPTSQSTVSDTDVDHLHALISNLQVSLQKTAAEKEEAEGRLDAVMTVMKRALEGDAQAANGLADVLGVKPPEVIEQGGESILVIPKGRPVSRESTYAEDEREQTEHQKLRVRHFLQARSDMYEEELQADQDLRARSTAPQSRISSGVGSRVSSASNQKTSLHERPKSGRVRPLGLTSTTHKHKPPTQSANLTLGQLFMGKPLQQRSQSIRKSHSLENINAPGDFMLNHTTLPPQPQGYLYDPSTVLGEERYARYKPVAPSSLKSGDNIRSRPKSAGIFLTQHIERPLAYETTVPIRKRSSSGSRAAFGSSGSRPPSGKSAGGTNKPPAGPSRGSTRVGGASKQRTRATSGKKNNSDPRKTENTEETSKYALDSAVELVEAFSQEKELERNFKDNLLDLQKKLNVNGDGVIDWYPTE